MEKNFGPDPIVTHSPRSHYHSHLAHADPSSSPNSESRSHSDSDVSDMVIDNPSRFKDLGRRERKGSDYHLPSDAPSESESGTGMNPSDESQSENSRSTASLKNKSSDVVVDDDDNDDYSEESSSRASSSLLLRVSKKQLERSPMVRKSPLSVSHRSNSKSVTSMRGYGYSMQPSRSVAANVSYSRYLQEDEEESDSSFPVRGNAGRRRKKQIESESEFEVSGKSEEASLSEELSNSEDFSEEDYRPPKQKGRTRKKVTGWIDSGSDSDYRPGNKKRHGKVVKRISRAKNDGYMHTFDSDGGGTTRSSSESEFEPGYVSKQRKKKRHKRANEDISPSDYVRTTGRKKGAVSYKDFYGSNDEDSDGGGGGNGERRGEDVEEGGEVPVLVEDNREAIEKILCKRIGKVGDIGDKTTCYARCLEAGSDPSVLESIGRGDKQSLALMTLTFNSLPPPPGEPSETQYLVKWRNWSHLHSTWETEASLLSRDIKGIKKFSNFLKREQEKEAWERTANPEEIEYIKCQEELSEQLLGQFTQVERVIAGRTNEDGTQEYQCKWRGLPYSECTWEDGNLVSNWFQEEIDAFIERNGSDCIPNKNSKVLRHRPRFIYMKEQHKSLGKEDGKFQLRDYQLEGVNWLIKSWCKGNSVILADEMGLGKTIQTIAFLHCLFHDHQLYGPFLIVVPLSTMPAWQKEFEQWAREINTVVYMGDVNSRSKIREFEWCHPNKKLKFNTILTTYEILLKDKDFLGSVAWSSLIIDEAHRLKNDDSLLYRTLMEFRTNHRLLITGTPLQNSLKELWSLLHFIMEKDFSSWEDFEYDHHDYGEGNTSTLTSIHQQLQPYLIRRIKKDVEKSLPAKVEKILRVEMSSVQKQYYRWILGKNYKALSKGVKGSITGFINIMMELKKCCNHIWIVRSPDDNEIKEKDKLQTLIRGSGKLYLLDKLLVRLYETGHRVLIFSQMVRMLDILADYMELRHFHFQRLDGSIRGDLRKDAIDHFNAEGSHDFCFLLSTRAGGLGVNLATADTVVIFDSDWNPQNDLQAQARAHRIGQKKQVNIYRLVTKNSLEEDIIEKAKKKMVLDHLVIQRMDTTGRTILSSSKEPNRSVPFDKEELNAILKFGAEELFKNDGGGGSGGGGGGAVGGDKELQEMDIDDILSRAETQSMVEDTSHNDLLSQFKVASFAMEEEEEEPAPPPPVTPTGGKSALLSPRSKSREVAVKKSWDDLIPEEFKKKIDEDEKAKEQIELYLPPRRKRKVPNYCEDGSQKVSSSKSSRTRGSKAEAPPTSMVTGGGGGYDTMISTNISGFTDSEIRRFLKSYRKFVNPKSRLEAIAADAELQEKSLSELHKLMVALHEGCVQAEDEHRERFKSKSERKKDKGACLRLCGVTMGSSSVLRREDELAALACVLPANPAVRRKYRLLTRPKGVHWEGTKWSAVDDARLLVGVYEHGFGNWESIRDDLNLSLTHKILHSDPALKPQSSHLQTRVEYLLKLLQVEAAEKVRKKKPPSKNPPSKNPRSKKSSSSHIITSKAQKTMKSSKKISDYLPPSQSNLMVNISRNLLDDAQAISDTDSNYSIRSRTRRKPAERTSREVKVQPKRSRASAVATRVAKVAASSPSRSRKKDKVFIPGERTSPRKRKRGGGGGHTSEDSERTGSVRHGGDMTESNDLDGVGSDGDRSGVELDDDTFQKPVKKSMLELQPKEEHAEKDLTAMGLFSKVLLEIGDHINSICLSEYEPDDVSLWKTNLWVFVSKFTKAGPKKLRKIYKRAKKYGETMKKKSKSDPLPEPLPHQPQAKENNKQPRPFHSDEPRPSSPSPRPKPRTYSGERVASYRDGHGPEREGYRDGHRERTRHSSGGSHYSGGERPRHHRGDRRRHHSSGSSYHSDGSSSKRPRYHSPPPPQSKHYSSSHHHHHHHHHAS